MIERMPLVESRAAFARRLGVHRSVVTRLAQSGRLIETDTGEIRIQESLARLAATEGGRTDLKAAHAARRLVSALGADVPASWPAAEAPAMVLPPATGPDSVGRTRYKALQVHLENQGIKLDLMLRRGQRHLLPVVKREAAGLGGTLRAALERFIDQTVPRLAVMSGEERAALLRDQHRALRRLLRAEFPRALRKVRAAAGG